MKISTKPTTSYIIAQMMESYNELTMSSNALMSKSSRGEPV